MDRRKFLQVVGGRGGIALFYLEVLAQGQTDRVLIVTEMTPNSPGHSNGGCQRGAYGVVWMTYDRLITFGLKTLPNGVKSYAGGKPGVAGVYTNQRLNLSKLWERLRKTCQGRTRKSGRLAL
jgi:hypothetical protein